MGKQIIKTIKEIKIETIEEVSFKEFEKTMKVIVKSKNPKKKQLQ